MGFTISSLYGSGGNTIDEDALRTRNIVIATPEARFRPAKRSEHHQQRWLHDIDEGHLIGPREHEIRYESLVQRLLRRTDRKSRRIVCLSAVLPAGES